MPSSLQLSRLIMAFGVIGLISGRAQTPAPATEPISPVVDPVKAAAAAKADESPGAPKRERVMSDELAGTLATGMPKYAPPPKAPEPKPEEATADAREADKPKNRIIRLPKYVVKEPLPPVFRERDLHSKSGLTDLGLKTNPGLRFGNLAGLNRPTALLMYEEQERLNNMSELKKEAKDARNSGDTTAADYILRENNRANYRPSDFGWNSDGGGK